MSQTWPAEVTSAQTVAEMLDWVRRKTKGRCLAIIAVSANSVAVCMDPALTPREAVEAVISEAELAVETLEWARARKETRAARARPRDGG